MNARLVLAAVAAASLAAGCTPRFRLPMKTLGPDALARVEVEDVRPATDRETFRSTSDLMCARSYGEEFVEPSSVAYLRALLAARVPDGATLHLRVERLDHLERCERWLQRYRKASWNSQGALGMLFGSGIKIPRGKDTFTLQFVGAVNGAPIRFRAGFEYDDEEYAGYPPNSEDYRERLARLFDDLASAIVKADARSNTPELDIEDLRAIYRARQQSSDEAARKAAAEAPPGA